MQQEEPGATQSSSLEKLQQRLYSQRQTAGFAEPSLAQRPPAPSSQPPVAWTPPPPPRPLPPRKPISWTFLFLGGAVLFFILTAGVSFFFVLQGGRSVSSAKIAITLQGPTTIASGTVVPLVVMIKNNNPAAITDTDLEIDFPDGTRSADDVTQPLSRYPATLGAIPAGGSVSRTVPAVLFGSTNQTITIPITFNYHTANSNALFTKQQNFTFTITSSPLTITTTAVQSVAPGQPFTIALVVRSNASTPLDSISVVGVYPADFTVQKTSLAALATSNNGQFFTIGTLAPGAEKDFTITGVLAGTNNDLRNFNFTVGTAKTDGTASIGVPYASQATAITLSKPFLDASLSLNNADSTTTIVAAGESVSGLVSWVNTLASAITSGTITIHFTGAALDPSSVSAQAGYYDSSSNSVIFTSQTQSGLASLNPGDTGSGAFSFASKVGSAISTLRTPTIQVSVSVSGRTVNGTQTITNTATRTVQIATSLGLASRLVHTSGPFSNTGPLPPVPNQATTYTAQLSVTNTVNSVGGTTVTMILPSYAVFTGKVSPTDGSIAYDDATRTVTWKVGDVPAGTSASKPITAAFQIAFTPSTSQSGTSPILVGSQTISGTDRFTNAKVGSVAPALTTTDSTDAGYQAAFGTVGN